MTSYDSKQLIIPLGMFFMKGPGSYFPLCAIAGCHEVTITVELRNLNELLVIKSAPTVLVVVQSQRIPKRVQDPPSLTQASRSISVSCAVTMCTSPALKRL